MCSREKKFVTHYALIRSRAIKTQELIIPPKIDQTTITSMPLCQSLAPEIRPSSCLCSCRTTYDVVIPVQKSLLDLATTCRVSSLTYCSAADVTPSPCKSRLHLCSLLANMDNALLQTSCTKTLDDCVNCQS